MPQVVKAYANGFAASGKSRVRKSDYNGDQPHSSLGYGTPNEFAEY